MIHEELKICKICNKKFDTNNKFTIHLKLEHNITLVDYILNYLDLPICKYCNKEKVTTYTRPLLGAYRNGGKLWKSTCSNKECQTKHNSKIQKNFYKDNEEAKEIHRKQRIEYLKKKTGKTAWERRAAREMSYLEQWFYDNVIIKYNLTKKYDIVNELCVYPYFIDFAFQNINVAVELDGKCHFNHGETRNGHDRKKDNFLIENGWKVFRIGYTENNEETINEFLSYISKIEAGEKVLEARVFKYKEIKKEKKKRTWNEWFQLDYQKRLQLNKPLIQLVKNSNIEFNKRGWKTKLGLLINKDSRKVIFWLEKYMPELYEKIK